MSNLIKYHSTYGLWFRYSYSLGHIQIIARAVIIPSVCRTSCHTFTSSHLLYNTFKITNELSLFIKSVVRPEKKVMPNATPVPARSGEI